MIHRSDLKRHLESPQSEKVLALLYGDDPSRQKQQRQRWLHLAKLYQEQFPQQEKLRLFSTPGRTEVGGNHTDHQQGRVLCASVDLDIIGLAAPNSDGIIRLKSEGFDSMDIVDLRQLRPVAEEKESSAALIRGIAAGFKSRGLSIGGMDVYTTSLVPKGSGLSSSAAFEILVATILDALYAGNQVTAVEKAIIAQEAENQYFGKPCGLMDQCGCSVGGFISIDFADPKKPVVESIPFDVAQAGHHLVITNTGGSHADLTDDYASVPRDMRAVAAKLGATVLSELDENQLWQSLGRLRGQIDDQAIMRAMHFFADHQRVLRQKKALQEDRFQDFLAEVRASGLSSWTRLQNVYSASQPREQPVSVGLALSEAILDGQGACRVHGGGFAGTIQAYVPNEKLQAYLDAMRDVFGEKAARQTQVRTTGATELKLV